MKKILVPTDFSVEAKNALSFAKKMAKKLDAEILLLHVLEVPYGSFSLMGEVVTNYSYENLYEETLVERAEEKLKDKVTSLRKAGVSAHYKVVFGHPFLSIKDTIAEEKSDLVIMGSKGASGLAEIFIGSNAERVIRNADCPVITVKGKADPDGIYSIAFATDASEEQDLIVPAITDFQKLLHLNLHLVRVCTPHNYLTETKAKEQLTAFAKRNHIENFSLGVAHGEFTDEGVIDFARSNKIKMIAMGTHGRTGVAHFFGGSITEDVANHAHIPVFTIKIPRQEEVLA